MSANAHLSARCGKSWGVRVLVCILCGAAQSAVAPATGAPTTAAACPPSSSASTPATSPAQEVVACVGSEPITGESFAHWITVQRSGQGSNEQGSPQARQHKAIEEVMDFLITSDWVRGEARDLHVHVATSTVRRAFDRLRREQFPDAREFHRFLKHTKETVPDLLLRVELQLLAQGIQRRVLAGHHGKRSQLRALARYVTRFQRKWKALTYCLTAYASPDCGHVQASV